LLSRLDSRPYRASARWLLTAMVLIALIGALSHAPGAKAQATAWTDKPDYAPGETVVISGTGLPADKTLVVQILRPLGTDLLPTQTDNSGSFTLAYELSPDRAMEGTYTVLVIDPLTSDILASTAFSDSPPERYSISITTVNGWPVSSLPPTIENPVELFGVFNVTSGSGHMDQYGVRIDWGDNSPYTIWEYPGAPYLTWEYTGEPQHAKDFNGTFNTNPPDFTDLGHNYASSGNYTITVKLFHQQPPGKESDDASFNITVYVIVKYNVTFAQTGLDSSASGTVLTVTVGSGAPVSKSFAELPYNVTVESGTNVTYAFTGLVPSTETGKQFTLALVSGPASPFTVTASTTITGNYETQYYLALATNPPGVATPQGEDWYDAGTSAGISTPQYVDITAGSSRYRFNGWTTGDMTEIADPSAVSTSVLMDKAKTVTANYLVQHNVTFAQEGVDSDYARTVVTVDSISYDVTGLPASFWWDKDSAHDFAFQSPLGVSAAKRYAWVSTSGISTLQAGSITVTTSGTVTGSYGTQYNLTFAQTGLDSSATGTVVTISGSARTYADLPYTLWADSGSSVAYSYEAMVASTTVGKRFQLAGVTGPGSPINVTAAATVTGSYLSQYHVLLDWTGLGADATGKVLTVTVAGSPTVKNAGDPSFDAWLNAGTTLGYAYENLVNSTMEGKQYMLDSVIGNSTQPSHDFGGLTGPVTETASYRTQYYLTVVSAYDTPGGQGWYDDGATAYATLETGLVTEDSTRHVFTGWSGDASGTGLRSDAILMTGPRTATANWKTQYLQRFDASANVKSDGLGTIVTVNGSSASAAALPYELWADAGAKVFYSYEQTVQSSVAGKRYRLDSVAGPTSGYTVSAGNTIAASYETQYQVSFAQAGLDETATGLVVTINGSGRTRADLPFSDWYDAGNVLVFQYADVVGSSAAGKRFRLIGVDQLSPLTVTQPLTVTGSYGTQYQVRVTWTGLGGDATGRVVTVTLGGTPSARNAGDSFFDVFVDAGTTLSYGYEQVVASTAAGKRYMLSSVVGNSTDASHDFGPLTGPVNETASYGVQYYLALETSPSGVAAPTGAGWYDQGAAAAISTPQSVDISPGSRYYFTGWTTADMAEIANASAASTTVLMDKAKTVTANYVKQLSLTVTASENIRLDGSGTIVTLTIDGTAPVYLSGSDLPFHAEIDVDTTITYSFTAPIVPGLSSAAARYRFSNVAVNDSTPSSSPSGAFAITGPTTLLGSYVTQFSVTFAANGLDSSASGTVVTIDGDVKTLSQLPNVTWLDSGASVTYGYASVVSSSQAGKRFRLDSVTGPASPITVTGPTAVTASYVTQYLVTFTQSGVGLDFTGVVAAINGTDYGQAQLSSGVALWADSGSEIGFTYYTPLDVNLGKRYVWTSTSGLSSAQSGSITVSQAGSVTGNYKTQFHLTVTSDHDSPTPTSGWFDAGTSIDASVTSPADDNGVGTRYRTTGWTGTGSVPASGTGATVTFTISQASSITWNWIAQYRLMVFSARDAPVPGSGEHWYDAGASVTASVTSPTDESEGVRYRCTSWAGTGSVPASGSEATVTFSLTEASSLTWNWQTQYYLAMGVSPLGSGTVSPGSGWHDAEALVGISAAPGSGYLFSNWTGVGEGSYTGASSSANVTMKAPITETAYFQAMPQLSVEVSANPAAITTVQSSVITVTVTSAGSPVAGASVTLSSNGGSLNMTLGSTDANGRLNASFASATPGTFTIGASASKEGYVPGFGSAQVAVSPLPYSYTVSVTGLGGGYSTGLYLDGSLRATLANGQSYTFSGLTGTHVISVDAVVNDGLGTRYQCSPSAITVSAPGSYVFGYVTQHYLTMSTIYGSVTPGSGWYNAGSNLTITASAPPAQEGVRYTWLGWNGTGTVSYSGPVNPASITMNSPITEAASWSLEYRLLVSSEHDSPVPGVGEHWYPAGTPVAASVTSPWPGETNETRHVCTGWTGTGSVPASGTSTGVDFVIHAPSNLTWNWRTEHYLTVTSPIGEPSGEGWYEENSTAYASFETGGITQENTRYIFVNWTGDASGMGLTSEPIVMEEPKTAVANWTAEFYVFTLDKSPRQGVMTIDNVTYSSFPVTQEWAPGSVHQVSVPPVEAGAEGTRYVFANWSDGSSLTDRIVVAQGPGGLIAYYDTQYRLVVSSEHGTTSGSGWYNAGATASISVSPTVVRYDERGIEYAFRRWLGSGAGGYYTGPENPAMVTMTGPVEERAEWEETMYYLSVISDYGEPQGSGWYPRGSQASFSVTTPVDQGNKTTRIFAQWSGDISLTQPSGVITMTRPSTVIASWETEYELLVKAAGVTDPFTATVTITASAATTRELSYTIPVQETLRQGTPVTLTISTPNRIGRGYWAVFREWTGDAQGTSRTTSVTMLSPRTVTAVFFKVNPVEESIPYSLLAGVVALAAAVLGTRRRRSNEQEARPQRKAVPLALGLIVAAVALSVAAIVSVTIATGYSIPVNELLDFTNWAVLFLGAEAVAFLIMTTAFTRRRTRAAAAAQG